MTQDSLRIRWILFFAAAAVVLLLATRVRLNLHSASAPRGIYLAADLTVRRGAQISSCLPEELGALGRARGYLDAGRCPGGARPVGKQIVAVAGDLVEVASEGLSVNGVRVAGTRRRLRDSAGRFIPAVPEGRYRVAPGEVWLVATFDPRSWDSRYYGPVALTEGAETLVPLLLLDAPGVAR